MLLLEEYIAVGLGGSVGAMLRFSMSRWVQGVMEDGFPWGIFTVNLLGSFFMGMLAGILLHRYTLGPFWRAAIFIGLLGGFTTFSSFSIDSITLIQSGDYAMATAYVLLTLVGCLFATFIGLELVKLAV